MEIGVALVFGALFLIIYWGATILLEATGLERRKARFQALSAIVGCGFTTGESESIVNHPRRRSIIYWLMVLGNTAVVGLIVGLIIAVGAAETPSWPFFLALGIVIAALIIAGRMGLFGRVNDAVVNAARRGWGRERHGSYEVVHQADSHGVVLLAVGKEAAAAGMTVGDTGISAVGATILAIERKDTVLPFPVADVKLGVNDRLLCYGELAKMSDLRW